MTDPRLLAGTENGLYELTGERQKFLGNHKINALAAEGPLLWAILDGNQVWTSNLETPWRRYSMMGMMKANCLLPTDQGLLIGTSEAHLMKADEDTLEMLHGFEEAEHREVWFTPWGGPPEVGSMARSPDGSLYVNVHIGGILRSSDDGASWKPTITMVADVRQVLIDAKSGWVLAASGRGLGISEDRGDSWRYEFKGLHDLYLGAAALAWDTLLVTASTGPKTDQAAVYRKPLGRSVAFERCIAGLPDWFPSNVDTHMLAASGVFAALGTEDGAVYLSRDEGRSWAVAAEGLPAVHCVALV